MARVQAALAEIFGAEACVVCAEPAPAMDALHPAERRLVARAAPSRQDQFSTGRLCAREALAGLGLPGAPLLARPDRSPAWPEGAVGSLSHTRGCCAVVVGRRPPWRALGLDVEGGAPLAARLEARVCRPEERAWLAGRDSAERGRLAKLLFCAKEAVYKCQHPLAGARLGFQDVRVVLDAETGVFQAEILGALPEAQRGLQHLEGRALRVEEWALAGVALRA